MQKRIIWGLILLSFNLQSQYIYEANQDLYQLQKNAGSFEGELAYEVGDDQLSTTIAIPFTFTFYNQQFDSARMATNGCLHFGLGTGNINYNNYCGDYTPDPISSQYTYTMFPFWTDLIRDSNSRIKSWGDNTKMIFGWYDMREYNRNSDNSFEVILYPNNTFEYRYDELDIINHDVIIGEVGANSNQVYQYLFHDECNVGTTNLSDCVNSDWNNTSSNTLLEGGGSLYGVGSGNAIDCSNPLNNVLCAGYADALLQQNCNLDSLYNTSCSGYQNAYDQQQCDLDSQYSPTCRGYRQEDSVAFFNNNTIDYGFVDEQEQFATGIFIDDRHNNPPFEDTFEIVPIFEEEMFPRFDDFRGDNINDFFEEQMPQDIIVIYELDPLPFIDDMQHHQDTRHEEDILVEQFVLQETVFVEDYSEPETFLVINTIEELDEWFEQERQEQGGNQNNRESEERVARNEEPEEEFIEEVFEEEVVEEVFEELEEVFEELQEEELLVDSEDILEEDLIEEEVEVVEKTGSNKTLRKTALALVNQSLKIASASVGGSDGQSGGSSYGGNANTSNSSSSGGISTSSSPSISDQISSSTAQNNIVLASFNNTSNGSQTSFTITPMPSLDNTQTGMVDVQVQNVQSQIDTAVGGVVTASEADQIADKIIAQNIEQQKEELQEQQQNTGEYGDETTLVALIGYVPNFNQYTNKVIPDRIDWYTSQNIYENVKMNDNINAYYGLANESITKLQSIISDEPNIWR